MSQSMMIRLRAKRGIDPSQIQVKAFDAAVELAEKHGLTVTDFDFVREEPDLTIMESRIGESSVYVFRAEGV